MATRTGFERFQESFSFATWFATVDEPGMVCATRSDGTPDRSRTTETEPQFNYLRIARIQEFGTMGLQPFIDAVGIRIESQDASEPKRPRTLTMRIPPIGQFCRQANKSVLSLPRALSGRMRFWVFDDDIYSHDLQMQLLSERMWILATGKSGTHDMLDHGMGALALSNELVSALAHTASYWLHRQPDADTPAYLVHRFRTDFLGFVENYVRAGAMIDLFKGQSATIRAWSYFLRDTNEDMVRGYALRGAEQLRQLGETRISRPRGFYNRLIGQSALHRI